MQLDFLVLNTREEIAGLRAPEMFRGFHSRLQLNTDQCHCVRKLLEEGKEPPKKGRWKNSWSSHKAGNNLCSKQSRWRNLVILGRLG